MSTVDIQVGSVRSRDTFIDADDLAAGSVIQCDVCIIGSGPAGITVANELAGTDIRTCLIESGGSSEESTVRASTVAKQLELPIDPYKFRQKFGGTSNAWSGLYGRWIRSNPMDPFDLETRP